MSDDPLSELLRSPLADADEEPSGRWRRSATGDRPPDRRTNPAWVPFVVSLAVGGAIVVAAAALSGGTEEPAPTPATTQAPTSSTVTPSVTAAPAAFPPGYVAINGRVGLRAERMLLRDDRLFVSFTTAVRSGLDGEFTTGFSGGRWELELDDGRTVRPLDEIFDPLVPSAFTVVFPVDDFVFDDITAVRITGDAYRSGTTYQMSLDVNGLPWSGRPPSDRIPLDEDLELVVEDLDFTIDGGTVRWRLEGDEDFAAAVSVEAQVFEGGSFPVGFMTEARPSTFFSFFGSAIGAEERSRDGEIELVGGRLSSETAVTKIDLSWFIDWVVYFPVDAAIPLNDVRRAEAG